LVFFFQAEDGIRDRNVTGVQTCALPISFTNSLLMVCALPTPDGYIGFFTAAHASNEHDYLINLEAVTDYFYPSYVGTLAQWKNRSEERRVGKGWRRRSRRSQTHDSEDST